MNKYAITNDAIKYRITNDIIKYAITYNVIIFAVTNYVKKNLKILVSNYASATTARSFVLFFVVVNVNSIYCIGCLTVTCTKIDTHTYRQKSDY